MRYEAKSEQEAVEAAAKALGTPASQLRYTVIRDEKSFWGGRVVEIEVEGGGGKQEAGEGRQEAGDSAQEAAAVFAAPPSPSTAEPVAEPSAEEVLAAVESTLTDLLSAAGLLVETRRRESTGDEMLFELFGDDVEPLLANKGEGLTGLEVLVGRIASKRLARPVHPRLDAEGFRAHRKEALEELAQQSATEVRRSRRPQLLPPLSPWERRLVHLALSEDPEVETESEGDGFLKRVEVRLKAQ
jgi:spoIIIJ-associated protein